MVRNVSLKELSCKWSLVTCKWHVVPPPAPDSMIQASDPALRTFPTGGEAARQMAFSGPWKVTHPSALAGYAKVTGSARLGAKHFRAICTVEFFWEVLSFQSCILLERSEISFVRFMPIMVCICVGFNTMHLADPWVLGLIGSLIQTPNI